MSPASIGRIPLLLLLLAVACGPPSVGPDGGIACSSADCAISPPPPPPPPPPAPICDATQSTSCHAFESRASLLGRVVGRDGSPRAGFTLRAYDAPVPVGAAPRDDLTVVTAADGSFRARLTAFPETEPAGAPPRHIVLRIESEGVLPAAREAFLHPGGVADLGVIKLVPRDPAVSMIGPEGGKASDSRGQIEVVFPRGALAAPTPIRLTSFQARDELPVPLPTATVTTYAVELEPDGLVFPAGAEPTVRIDNWRKLPTDLEIPVGLANWRSGEWAHEGMAAWDGQRFAFKVSHFSPRDINPSDTGQWLIHAEEEQRNGGDKLCVGSTVSVADGALTQSFTLPAYQRASRSYAVTVEYDSQLAGALSPVAPPRYDAAPGAAVSATSRNKVRMECLPRAFVDNIVATTPGTCAGPPCGGSVFLSPDTFLFDAGRGVVPIVPLKDTLETIVESSVELPGDPGVTPSPAFVPQRVSILRVGRACVGSGRAFGQSGSAVPPVELATDPQPVVEEERQIFVPHRLDSPIGAGWSIAGIGRVFRSPAVTEAVLMSGSKVERFLPRATTSRVLDLIERPRALARDDQTGEILLAAPADVPEKGIGTVEIDRGAVKPVLPGVSCTPMAMAVTYVAGVRHMVVACSDRLVDVDGDGKERELRRRDVRSPTYAFQVPGVAARGEWAYYVEGNAYSPVLYRFKLSDVAPTAQALTREAGGDISLRPQGPASSVRLGDPHGLALAPDGTLFIADRQRNVVYQVLKNGAGEIAGDSLLQVAVGTGGGQFAGAIGSRKVGRRFEITQPILLSAAQDGSLWIVNFHGAAVYDPKTTEAAWMVHDGTFPESELGYQLLARGGATNYASDLLAIGADSFLLHVHSVVVRFDVARYASQRDPTRTLSFSPDGATLTDTEADQRDIYDRFGRLIERWTRAGAPLLRVSYLEDKSERIDRILDPKGGFFQFGYSGTRLASITDHAGRATRFDVDAAGNLAELHEPDGRRYRFQYDGHKMVAKVSPQDDETRYTYAADGTVRTTLRPSGETFQLSPAYSQKEQAAGGGRTVRAGSYVDARGVTHAFTLDGTGQIETDRYTADGTVYTTRREKADFLGPPMGRNFLALLRNNQLNRTARVTVNGLAGLESEYDQLGRLVNLSKFGSTTGTNLALYSYDADGRLATFWQGPANRDFVIDRDAKGRPTRIWERHLDVPGGPSGLELRATWRDDDLPASTTERGVTTSYVYDDATGNLRSASDTLGRSASVTYDAAGNIVTKSDGLAEWTFDHDAGGRLVRAGDAAGNVTTLGYTSSCGCSERDLLSSIQTPDLPAGKQWRLDYGPEGRLKSLTDPEGAAEQYEYEPTGELKKVTDRLGRTTQIVYDHLGRAKGVLDALGRARALTYPVPTGSKLSGPSLLAGGPAAMAPSSDVTTALAGGEYQLGIMGYDAVERVLNPTRSLQLPQVSYYRDATFQLSYGHEWDAEGRLRARYDRGGASIASGVANPGGVGAYWGVAFEWHPGTAAPVLTRRVALLPAGYEAARIDYDVEYHVASEEGWWRTFPYATYDYGRDAGGRLVSVARTYKESPTFAGPGSRYEYYPDGRLKKLVDANGTQDLTYDARGLLQQVTIGAEGTYRYDRDALGRDKKLTYPDGHARTQRYDTQGRLTERCYTYADAAFDRCYTALYDRVGNPVELGDPEGKDLIEYDALDRVTKVTRKVTGQPDVVEAYGYNALGAVKNNAGAALDDQRPQLGGGGTADAAVPATIGGAPITLDPVGRVTSLRGVKFEYLVRGTLQAVKRPDDRWEGFGHDAYDRRITRVRSELIAGVRKVTQQEHYVWEGNDLVAVLDGSGTVKETYLFDGVDHALRLRRGGVNTYYELDLAGNVRRLRDAAGKDLGGFRYRAFGATLPADGKTPAPTVTQPLRWKGRWYEDFAGELYDVRARWWSPELATFLGIDELAYHDTKSTLWGWPGQSPYRHMDPTGHISPTAVGVLTVIAAAIAAVAVPSDQDASPAYAFAPFAAAAVAAAGPALAAADVELGIAAWGAFDKLPAAARLALALLGIVAPDTKGYGPSGRAAAKAACAATKAAPKPSPKFMPPTNPPQHPPSIVPEGWRVREMPTTPQYPDGYWKLEKPLKDGSWQPIDPSTMKPGGRPQTHIPFPPEK